MDYILTLNFRGLIIGLCTFLIIGLFHPLVIKGEYYLGQRSKWIFAVMGILFTILTLMVSDSMWSSLLGVTAFCCFWSIKEVKEQEERVRNGWFPSNPKRVRTSELDRKA